MQTSLSLPVVSIHKLLAVHCAASIASCTSVVPSYVSVLDEKLSFESSSVFRETGRFTSQLSVSYVCLSVYLSVCRTFWQLPWILLPGDAF